MGKRAIDEFTLLCERCGYVVEGLPREGKCPECGLEIARSLPERRKGTAWQQEPGWRGYLRTGWQVVRHPLRTLDEMRISEDRPSLLWMHLSVAGIIAGAQCAALFATASILMASENHIAWVAAGGLLGVGLGTVLGIVVFSLLHILTAIEAGGLRFFGQQRGFRISPTIAWVVCAHGSVGWVLAAVGWTVAVVIVVVLTARSNLELPPMALLAPLLAAVPGFLFFEVFAWLGLRRCRFANRARPEKYAPDSLESEHDAQTPHTPDPRR